MQSNTRRQRKQDTRTTRGKTRAAAMVTTMMGVSLGSLAAASVATVTLSSYSRAINDQNSAKALDLAESAALFQMQRIMASSGRTQTPYNGSNLETASYGMLARPLPITAKGYNGSTGNNLNAFLGLNSSRGDHCIAWIEYPDNSSRQFSMSSSDDVYVYGQAQVGGVWRRVRYTAGSGAMFDKWSCFAYSEVNYPGKLSCLPKPGTGVTRPGCVASTRKISCGNRNNQIGKQCVYGDADPEPSLPYTWGGNSCDIPKCKDLATRCHSDGGYGAVSGYTGVKKFCGTVSNSSANDNYNYGRVYTSSGNWTNISGTGSLGSRQGNACYFQGKSQSSPCNFYLRKLQGNHQRISCNVRNGPVNIWVDSDEDEDVLTGDLNIVAYEDTDRYGNPIATMNACKKVRIYYNNNKPNGCLRLNTSSSSMFCGMLYAFDRDDDDDTPRGTIEVNGTCNIYGGVACNKLRGSGTCSITYPQNVGVEDNGDTYFEIRGGFQEVAPVRGN